MKASKSILCILLLMIATSMNAQLKFPGGIPGYWTPNPNAFVDVQTPTAASLGKYGDVDVSYFTGNPNISIPLYELDVRGVKMPISLDYDATGVMPNSLPSWAGQNWTLNVGGVIARTAKGRYDEWKYPKQVEDGFYRKPVSYFEGHNKLSEYMSEGGRYGSLKDNVEYGGYDLAPDEFTFHFMGKSGKFFLDQDGNWRVRSNDNIEVIYDCDNPSNLIGSLFEGYPYASAVDREQSKTIAGFVLRDDEGNRYTFGYDKNAIDYTTNFWHMSANEKSEAWHASSWYLTKVSDKYGNVLYKLHYKRGHYVIQVFNAFYSDRIDESASGMLGTSASFTMTNSYFPYTISINSPVYLTRIEAMNGISMDLYSNIVLEELSTAKLYRKLYDAEGGVQGLYYKLCSMVGNWGMPQYGDPTGAFYYLQSNNDSLSQFRYPASNDEDVLNRSRLRKLYTMSIQFDKMKPMDYIGYRFCMTETNGRLRLDSLMVQDAAIHYSGQTGIKGIYRFKYNKFDELPSDYLTRCVDHWGYYNGRPYRNLDYNTANDLETVRNPDFNYTPIGILNEIVYPTGGVTDFEYEPNTYGKKLSNDRQSISNAEGIGGGLRIKSIKSYDSPDKKELLSQRDFSYNIPGTNTSSGELFATPLYYWKDWNLRCEENNASYHMTTSHTSSIVPLANSTGVSLGYSYVTEKIMDKDIPGKAMESRVYHYSNISDPSVRDQRFTLTFGYADQFTPYDEWSELGFKKGLLLSEEVYDENGEKVKATGYKFRKDDCLKDYVLTSNLVYECFGNSAQYYHYLGGIYKLYYPKYDLVEEQDTIFGTKGKMVTSHTYDKQDIRFTTWRPYKHQVDVRITGSETLRRGMLTEKNTYTFGDFHASQGNDSTLYKGYFCIKPFKTTYERNGQLISEESTIYSKFRINYVNRLLPRMVVSTNSFGVTDTLVTYRQYSTTGMPTEYKEKGKPATYLSWAWNDCYLLMVGNAKIPVKLSDSEFLSQQHCIDYMSAVIKGYGSGQITGYAWNPLFGPVAIIRPNGNVNTFKYDTFGRLVSIYDYNKALLKEYQYNYRK